MKKLLVFIAALMLVGGFAFAQSGNTGLSVGIEGGMENILEGNNGERIPYFMPMLIFENSFGALDIFAELDYKQWLKKSYSFQDNKDVYPKKLEFDLALAYNIGIGSGSIVSILLENWDDIYLAPRQSDDLFTVDGEFTPGLRFTQGTAFGNFFLQGDYLIYYDIPKNEYDDEFRSDLNFSIGLNTPGGFGLKIKEKNAFTPDMNWYTGLDAAVFYGNSQVYAEVEAEFQEELDWGVKITPEIDFFFNRTTFYVKCVFDNIAAEGDRDITLAPALGLKFNL